MLDTVASAASDVQIGSVFSKVKRADALSPRRARRKHHWTMNIHHMCKYVSFIHTLNGFGVNVGGISECYVI